MNNFPLAICNIYAPNENSPSFFQQLGRYLKEVTTSTIIIGGDFNVVCENCLDRSGRVANTVTSGQNALQWMNGEMGLADAWRTLHPTGRDYTFFSNPTGTYSRLDMFMVSNTFLSNIERCDIGNIVISDHAPVDLVMEMGHRGKKTATWSLNPIELTIPQKENLYKGEIKGYFRDNKGSVSTQRVLWDAFKAVIRGVAIKERAGEIKGDREKVTKLEEKIKLLETSTVQTRGKEVQRQLTLAKYELNKIFQKKAEKALFRLQLKEYESGQKAGKHLAWQLKCRQNKRTIAAIRNSEGRVLQRAEQINDTFRDFYQKLYSSESRCKREDLRSYLNQINLERIPTEDMAFLESKFTKGEVTQVIKALPVGKSPGPDGLPAEFYKKIP